jgi:hypothetical protein
MVYGSERNGGGLIVRRHPTGRQISAEAGCLTPFSFHLFLSHDAMLREALTSD